MDKVAWMRTMALGLFLAVVTAAWSEDQVLFRDDFADPAAAGANPACKPVTDASGRKYLACQPAKYGLLYPSWEARRTAIPTAGKNYELDFSFRFPKEGAGTFDVLLSYGDGKRVQAIRFDPAGCASAGIQGQNVIAPLHRAGWSAYGQSALQTGEWCRAVIQVAGRQFEVHLERDGVRRRMMAGDIPDAPCGFNLRLAKDPVDLSDLTVRQTQPPPQEFKMVGGLREAQSFSVTNIPVTPNDDRIGFYLREGHGSPGPRLILTWTNQKDLVINTGVMSRRARIKVTENKTATLKDVVLEDQYIQYAPYIPPWKTIDNYVRPNLDRYTDDQQGALFATWTQGPGASTWAARIEFRRAARGWEFWVDGCYASFFGTNALLTNIKLLLPAGAAMSEPVCGRTDDRGPYLPLNMAHIVRPSGMKGAALSLLGGAPSLDGVPIAVAGKGESADVGRVRTCRGLEMLEVDHDLSRSPLDGMPEHLHYSVPLAQYIRAWVLCAVENDPRKEPILTARLTRFAPGGRGEAIADTSVVLPRDGEKAGPGIRQAGSVTYMANGTNTTAPLWWCEIPLKVGEIQDLLWGERNGVLPLQGEYLDFEFLGKVGEYPRGSIKHKPDPDSTSAVHVFAVTLEKTPVELEARKTQVANIFHNDEKQEMQLVLRPRNDFNGRLSWTIRDVDGKDVETRGERLRMAATEPEQVLTVPLAMEEPGWYGIDITLSDRAGRELIRHPASFVLLGPDTRKAGYESPYMAWWFGRAHGGTADPAIGGAMLQKMGVRRTTFGWHDKDVCESNLAPWKLTLAQIGWMGRHYRTNDWVQGAIQQEAAVREILAKWPHCRTALLFHEGYPTFIPPELRDATPTEEERTLSDWDQRILKLADVVSKVYREKFPQLRIQLGNTTHSCSLIAMLLRNQFPRERFDGLGLETVGQTLPPENSVMTEAWMERETARKFGFDVSVSACYEFTVRDVRNLGPKQQAEWQMRDALISHGLRFTDVAMPGLYDPSGSYYLTTWGSGGACQRYPLLYPRPAVAAAATLTKVLDQARLRRQVPTGSHSLFALEFERGPDTVYALWVPRGEARVTMDFDSAAALTLIDLYGRQRSATARNGKLDLTVGTAAQYVIGPASNATITVGGRAFPEHLPPANQQVASRMDDLAAWELRLGRDYRVHDPESKNWPLLTNGTFTLRQVRDDEKGPCLELELTPKGRLPDLMHEYGGLRLKTPQVLHGEPSTVGMWVKGNSSWGRVLFEFQDAEGEWWLSRGHYLDWPGNLCLNFDGWCFLSFPITSRSKVKALTAGGEKGQWISNDDKKIQYPIRMTGLVVEFPRKAINLNEMEPVKPAIRFKDLSAWE